MAKGYWAWSNVLTIDEDGKPTTTRRGSKVTASGLGISADEFQDKIDSGAFKDKEFPAPDDYEGSALDWYRDQLVAASSPLEEVIAEAEIGETDSGKDK